MRLTKEVYDSGNGLLVIDWNRILKAVQETAPGNETAQREAWELIEGYVKKFSPYDVSWDILHVEPEVYCCLNDDTILVGRIDLIARNSQGEPFFGEWKTANPRRRGKWQSDWIMSPQSLTYGVLTRYGMIHGADLTTADLPIIRKFCVRVALKSKPPGYEFEWFSFGDGELEAWKKEVIEIADEIRALRLNKLDGPWFPNFSYCNRYGDKYICPYQRGCSTQRWNEATGYVQRLSHLEFERAAKSNDRLVILDASRIDVYLNCREKYRKEYERNLTTEDGAALTLGSAFHSGVGQYFTQIQQWKKQ